MNTIDNKPKQSESALTPVELESRRQEALKDAKDVKAKMNKGLSRADAVAVVQRQREYDALPLSKKRAAKVQQQAAPPFTAAEIECSRKGDAKAVAAKTDKGLSRADAVAIVQRQHEYDALPHSRKRQAKVAEFLKTKTS